MMVGDVPEGEEGFFTRLTGEGSSASWPRFVPPEVLSGIVRAIALMT